MKRLNEELQFNRIPINIHMFTKQHQTPNEN